jgi:hypothetical protein
MKALVIFLCFLSCSNALSVHAAEVAQEWNFSFPIKNAVIKKTDTPSKYGELLIRNPPKKVVAYTLTPEYERQSTDLERFVEFWTKLGEVKDVKFAINPPMAVILDNDRKAVQDVVGVTLRKARVRNGSLIFDINLVNDGDLVKKLVGKNHAIKTISGNQVLKNVEIFVDMPSFSSKRSQNNLSALRPLSNSNPQLMSCNGVDAYFQSCWNFWIAQVSFCGAPIDPSNSQNCFYINGYGTFAPNNNDFEYIPWGGGSSWVQTQWSPPYAFSNGELVGTDMTTWKTWYISSRCGEFMAAFSYYGGCM